ncbi:MAG: cytochrome c3 family protein [Stygiobacter sp.]
MSNCTKCHKIGNTIQKDECLACHKELKDLIIQNRGYHSSIEVKNQNCIKCHSEHNGVDFKLINFKTSSFNHDLTGFKLLNSHLKVDCKDCHKKDFIKDFKLKNKKLTYLGLNSNCITCHQDIHQGTLGDKCESCHNENKFKNPIKFDHDKAKFKLTGQHRNVVCEKCHTVSIKNGKEFKNFKNIKFGSCINCHKDIHEGKFGDKCEKCHSTLSFNKLNNQSSFYHDLTNFKLIGKHNNVTCNKCHKNNFTKNLKYEKCNDCHEDYHKGEFRKDTNLTDCKVCHDENGFNKTHFTIDNHLKSLFPLTGSHLATACNLCHYKNLEWKFKLSSNCQTCHLNPHKNSSKIVASNECTYCHNTNSWNEITFNHSQTKFILIGKHQKANCIDCHTSEVKLGLKSILFNHESKCQTCHEDNHNDQFSVAGTTDCQLCHEFENWNATKFNHNKTRFKLDGGHSNVECSKCHKKITVNDKIFTLYKLGEVKCANCHA